MTTSRRAGTPPSMDCEQVTELSGLYVLGALEAPEREAVVEHLATCRQAHDEVRELGGVVPALASVAEPIAAPAELKARVMDAVAREGAAQRTRTAVATAGNAVRASSAAPVRDHLARRADRAAPARAAWRLPAWAGWTAAAFALLVVAVTGLWGIGLQGRIDQANQRAAVLSEALAAFSAPGSSVAVLRQTGSEPAAGSGFAAITADGDAYIVVVGLSPAPTGQAYQAWYIAVGAPVSAGLLSVAEDGSAVLADTGVLAGTRIVALTLEPAGGSDQPTRQPFVAGELRPV